MNGFVALFNSEKLGRELKIRQERRIKSILRSVRDLIFETDDEFLDFINRIENVYFEENKYGKEQILDGQRRNVENKRSDEEKQE